MLKKQQNTAPAAAAYVLGMITGIIILLVTEKKDTYTRFHAVQSIFFHITVIVTGWIITPLLAPSGFSPLMLSGTSMLILPLYFLAAVIVWVVLMVKAYNGIRFKLPYIGALAENLTNK